MDERTRRAWVDVDLGALKRNATALASRAGKPLLPMVKADAYGLGAVPVVHALEALEPWGYGVATLAEIEELRAAGVSRPVLIFTPVLTHDFPEVRRLGGTPTLGDRQVLDQWIASGGGRWHLAIDTGMHRAGVEWWRTGELRDLVLRHPPEGAFTHFHSADLDDATYALQRSRFDEAVSALAVRPPLLHAENSPAIERESRSVFDLVRPGVFLYGVGGRPGNVLRPETVAHLRARIVEVREVPDAETVSYGGTWRSEGRRRVATLAIGYADGYRRLFGNRGRVLIRGKEAPVIGRITMDMTMVDVTDIACETGEIATLLGRDGAACLDLNVVAPDVELLAYELLVGLRLRLPRRYHEAC
jgi:alanine racemase